MSAVYPPDSHNVKEFIEIFLAWIDIRFEKSFMKKQFDKKIEIHDQYIVYEFFLGGYMA